MNAQARYKYILIVFGVLISLHYILSFSHEAYGRATSLSNITSQFGKGSQSQNGVPEDYYHDATTTLAPGSGTSPADLPGDLLTRKANATFVMLARNSDLDGTVRSIREMEDRFNRKFGYPWVLLNEVPFTDEFKKRVSNIVTSSVEFGVIPHDHWFQPDSIDESRASAARKKMEDDNIIYGGSVSYRNMCRYNSGFFFKHELVQKYRYYWRVEPDVHFHCDISFDPFLFMQDKKKVYSFTITMYEYEATIKTLWSAVKEFINIHPEYIAKDNAMGYMSDNGGDTYNLCHFWSNFEIADLDFWRGEAYSSFFEFLDSKGGFYYERWGDAPVHSIAASLFAHRDQIHFFDEIGYEHNPYTHCPQKEETWKRERCSCDRARSFDYDGYSCMKQWDKFMAS